MNNFYDSDLEGCYEIAIKESLEDSYKIDATQIIALEKCYNLNPSDDNDNPQPDTPNPSPNR